MSIYIHIPYCKQKCSYCNFHFSTNLSSSEKMIQAICSELSDRKHELQKPPKTIYLGGGTPSILTATELQFIFDTLQAEYSFEEVAEITLECNPDDITEDKLQFWKTLGINRLSIGIQSFFEEDLQLMNRSHSAQQAEECIHLAKKIGFDNITIDLIYGSSTTTTEMWKENLAKLQEFHIPHFSSYALTVEENTVLAHQIAEKKLPEVDDEKQFQHFQILQKFAKENDYIQYEISNFGKKNHFSEHNSNYWKAQEYLGIGPSAHSFNGKNTRRINMANNSKYIQKVQNQEPYFEEEFLSEAEQYNEFVMIGLRSIYGISTEDLETLFSVEIQNYFFKNIQKYVENGMIVQENQIYTLHPNHYFKADGIASDLFWV